MKSIVITGCNRGLGLGLIKQLVKETNSPNKIIATCRNIEKAQELQNIAAQHKNVNILQLDVRKTDSFQDFTNEVRKIVQDDGLNVLFNNAGCSPKSTRINFVKAEQMMDTFAVNTVGPIMLTKALLPTLKQAVDVNKDKPMGCTKALILNMSSSLGSITLNNDGGLYPYRCSKAALNIATKSLSIDLKKDGILVACLHPGWVKTDMGGPSAHMDIDTSTSSIVKLINTLDERHHGEFFQWNGEQMQW